MAAINTMTSFSIHQERWQDVWVAATAAVKSRKKQQVEFNIQQRVDQLLQEFGPQSASPLTLRVYGTMMKGFSVLNNERARLLYTDSERVVVMFSQRPIGEDALGSKLPAAKRQRTDALSLNLELSKVPESEMFNWSQTPLEDASFLQLDSSLQLAPLPDAQELPQLSLLEDARLLDQSFPAIDMQAIVPLDAAAEALRMAEAAEALKASPGTPGAAPAFPPVAEVVRVQELAASAEQPAFTMAELIASAGEVTDMVPPIAPEIDEAAVVVRRGPRGLPQLPGPGHVYGFDELTQLSAIEFDEWQINDHAIGNRQLEPAEFLEALLEETPEPDRLGMLHAILDPMSDAAALQRLIGLGSRGATAIADNGVTWLTADRKMAQAGSMPEVQALLACDEDLHDALQLDSNAMLPSLDGPIEWTPEGSVLDPFRPYVPAAPLPFMQGADMELAGALGAQGNQIGDATPGCDDVEDIEDVEKKYDEQTAQVASILHHYMEKTGGNSRKVTLDDLIPPSTTDKEIAAKTFLAILTLATAGDLRAEQLQPYGPIGVQCLD